MAEALVAFRFAHFATAMAAFGIGAFRLYAFAGAPAATAASPARAHLDDSPRRATMAAALVLLLTALAIVPCVTAEMAGSAIAGFDLAMDRTVMTETAF